MCFLCTSTLLIRLQTCTNTLEMRFIVKPVKPGDKLEHHARPMAEVMKEVREALAEYGAIKQRMAAKSQGNEQAG